MIAKGIDASYNPPNYEQVKAAGYKWVIRYVSPQPGKNLAGGNEKERIFGAGLTMPGVVWENASQDALRGAPGGRADAAEALKQARALGMPARNVIWFAAGDFDAQPAQFPTIRGYFLGVDAALRNSGYLIGAYGGAGLLRDLKAQGIVRYFWQACAPYGWYGNRAPWDGAHIWQKQVDKNLYGGSVDLNEQNLPVPQWTKSGEVVNVPASTPAPPKVLHITQRLRVALGEDAGKSPKDRPNDTIGQLIRQYVEIVYNHGGLQDELKQLVMTSNFRVKDDGGYHHRLDDTGAADIADPSYPSRDASLRMRHLARIYYSNSGVPLELIHTTPFADDQGFYIRNKRKVNAASFGKEVPKHLNHVHVAYRERDLRSLIARTLKAYGISKIVYDA